MKPTHSKLVRSHIPEITNRIGMNCTATILNLDQITPSLALKLVEEAN